MKNKVLFILALFIPFIIYSQRQVKIWNNGEIVRVMYADSVALKKSSAIKTYKVSASTSGGGTVLGSGIYNEGSMAEMTAIPDDGFVFSQWSDGVSINPRTLTVAGDMTVVAQFVSSNPIYTLTLDVSSIEGGMVKGGGSYQSGETVTLTAIPSSGYEFVKWSDGVTDNPRTLTVTGDETLSAVFAMVDYSVTVSAIPGVGGVVSGGGIYSFGATATIKAVPSSGYVFTKWSDGVTTNPHTITVTGSVIYEAIFEKIEEPLESLEPLDKSLGRLPGRFSVSATKKVQFAMGNLQYQASTDTWRFAENQYDVIGEDNENISSTYSGWIDLFGWGTSGYNSKYPYMTRTGYSDYGDGINDIAGTDYDWGVYNAISNGGNKAGMWRTLTRSEWDYLFNNRTDAKNLRGQATVNGQTGYILLPDGWSKPSGLTFTADPADFTTNSYSASEWSRMEAAGAVFLPAAGCRDGTSFGDVGSFGRYWSSSYYGSSNGLASYFCFKWSQVVGTPYYYRYFGFSVRLVQE